MNEKTMKTLFSSKSMEWETNLTFFNKLNKTFKFTLDPCATNENALCKKYYTIAEDGLAQSWEGERVFMNPPYGRTIILKWIKKAYEESRDENTLVVCLVPNRSDRDWMQIYGGKADWIVDIYGRLRFDNRLLPQWKSDGSHREELNDAPFPSRLIIFGKNILQKQLEELTKIGMLLKPINLNTINDEI